VIVSSTSAMEGAEMATLTAFEAGLFGWMAAMMLVLFPASRLHPEAWCSVLDADRDDHRLHPSWPANVWLIRRGIKETM
jgi:hypothetical protein